MSEIVCCIFNVGPHYREPVYRLMDEELNCHFYFGSSPNNRMKLMDYGKLKGYKKTTKNIAIPRTGFTWHVGVWTLIFRKYKHYVITGTPGSLSNWMLVVFARLLRKKVHAWTHGMKGNNTPFGTFVEKNFYRLCTTLLLYGNYSKEVMIRQGFKSEKLVPIYNSLDYKNQINIRKGLKKSNIFKNHFGNELPTITYIGRIQKSKKLDLLIEALQKLRAKNTLCNLCIIGSAIDDNSIFDLVKEYGVENQVWFYGPSYDETEIGNLLFNSEVCVSPGLIGLTAIHALTYGVPVITSDQYAKHGPEFEAIEKGKTGDFFENGNIDDLCKKILSWIGLDEIKREKVRQIAYQKIDTMYNPSFQLKVLKKIIEN